MKQKNTSGFKGSPLLKILGDLSLGKRIMLLTTLGLLVGASVLVYPGLRATNEATDMMLEDRLTTARLVADSLDESLRLSLSILQTTAQQISIVQTPADFARETEALQTTYMRLSLFIDSMYLFDESGRLIWSKPYPLDGNSDSLVLLLSAVKGLGSTEPAVSGLVASPVSKNPVVLLTCATASSTQAQSGRLTLAIDLARSGFMGLVRPMKLGTTGYVEVVDESGVVVVRTEPGPKIAPFEKSDHSGHFSELIKTNKPTRGLCHNCHIATQTVTTRDVLAFVPLTVARWGVVIRQSEEEALAHVRRLRRNLLLSGLGLICVAFVMAGLTTRNIVNRVKTLTSASQRIAGGDLDSPVTPSGKDEIGTLAQTLESMRSRLKTSYMEIEQRTRELSSLLAISEVLASLPGLSDLTLALGNALDRTLDIVKMDAGALLLVNEERNTLHYQVYRGIPQDYAENAAYQMTDLGENTGHPGESIVVQNLEANPAGLLQAQLRTQGMRTLVSVLLRSKQGISGVLILANREARELSPQEARLVEGISHYITTALENARLHREIQNKEVVRGELLQDILTVQEEERRRIARELHDETSQVLASLNANLEAAVSTLHTDDRKTETLLKKVQSMSVSIMDNINKLIYQLRPSLLDDLGLVAAIRWLEANNLRPAGIKARLTTKGRRRRLSREMETAIFRVVQEAFNNISRHAHAGQVNVSLLFTEGLVALDIEDDGAGFDVEEAIHSKERPRGLGLLGMTERIELIGGKITIRSQHSQGTHIHIEIPERKETQDG